MGRFYSTMLLCLCLVSLANAAPKYWVGPQNGDWSSSANWSNSSGGPGGASAPGAPDSVIFSTGSAILVHIDISPTIGALSVYANTTLYASSPVVFTLLSSLYVGRFYILKDSTSADVPFNVVLNGATNARGTVYGDWVFEGGVPLSNRGITGATVIAEPGSVLTVISATDGSTYFGYKGGQVIFKRNTGTIVSDKTSLVISYNTNFIFDDNLDAKVPLATWLGDVLAMPSYGGTLRSPAATFIIRTNMDKLEYSEMSPEFGRVVLELNALGADKDLSLPNGTKIRGNLEIYNTNGHTLTLLAATSPTSTVDVEVGIPSNGAGFGGTFIVSGNTTKVALARATAASPSTNFSLITRKDFNQSGGNFSLQDYNGATGYTHLEIVNNLVQTGGTFYTNSTSTTGKFAVTMANPLYITGPSGSFQSSRFINMSSGTIDNAIHNVTLRIDHSVYVISGYQTNLNGVILNSPLQVGKLELVRSPLTTTTVNVLTVNNPSPDAIVIGGPSSNFNNGYSSGPNATSYVNGPIRRATNSTQPYLFPTGKGNFYVPADFATYSRSLLYDSCYVIPTSGTPSVYQAEYFKTGYPDVNVTAPLLGVSQNEYWDFTRISGGEAQVKFKLTNPVVSAAGSQTLVAAHYENGHWVSAQGSTITPCAVTDSFIVSKPMSDFSPFTFGYLTDASAPTVPANLSKGLAYKFYQGTFTSLPDFNTLTPVTSGVINNVDVTVRPVGSDYNYAFKWDGFITITTPGSYTFETVSDDGSKVYFNTAYCLGAASVVSNDGVHAAMSAKGVINIATAGTYPITITYFQNYSGQTMQLYWTGPGISRQPIPDAVFSYATEITPPPQTGTGLNYKYYEGSFNTLPDFSALTPVKKGNTPNVDINVRTAGVNDNFAFTWDGTIKILAAGTYTFETLSDDGSRLTFNGNVLVNNDGLHAPATATGTVTVPAGIYPISISYFEKDGGENMQVYWTGPGIARQLVPDGVFGSVEVTPQPPTYGLNYKYYEGDFNALPNFSTLTPVKTGVSPNVKIDVRPAGVYDHFAFVWEGSVKITTAGTYYFETVSDDGSKVFINGLPVVDNDGLHAPNSVSKSISLQVGAYPIRIEYFEKDGGETMQLYWSAPLVGRQLIPDEAFLLATPPPPAPGAPGLNYKFYQGDWIFLPDYSALTPVQTGTSANVDIGVRPPGVNDHFAFMWYGFINLPAAGTYTFETISDDGSRVYFNMNYSVFGAAVVNNEGVHAPNAVSGTVTVPAAGQYPITITFFEKDGGETMQFYWSGPGISRQLVPDAAFSTSNASTNPLLMSGVEKMNFTGAVKDETIAGAKMYPNPFVESFSIDYYNSGSVKNKVSIGLYDLNGKLIYTYQPANLLTGYNRWNLNLGSKNLAAGIYLAQIYVNGIPSKTIKLVKAKK